MVFVFVLKSDQASGPIMTLALGTRAKNEFFDHRLHPNHHFQRTSKSLWIKSQTIIFRLQTNGFENTKSQIIVFRRQTKVFESKAELNDQLSAPRQSCRQESCQLTVGQTENYLITFILLSYSKDIWRKIYLQEF